MPQSFKAMHLLRKRAGHATCAACRTYKRVLGNVCRSCRTNAEGTHARDLATGGGTVFTSGRSISGQIARRNPRYA